MKLHYKGLEPIINVVFGKFEPGEVKEVYSNEADVYALVNTNAQTWELLPEKKAEDIKNKALVNDKKIIVNDVSKNEVK
jgi:hypothetical protein